MEENQPKTGKYALIYGGIAGLIGIVFALMLYSLDMQYEQGFEIQAVQFAILSFAVVLAIYQYKKDNSGYLSIVQAIKVAPGVAIISFIIGILWFLIFSNIIEPDFMANSMKIGRQKALEQNPEMSIEQIDQGMELQKSFFWVIMAVFMLISAVFATIIGLIAGLIKKKQKDTY